MPATYLLRQRLQYKNDELAVFAILKGAYVDEPFLLTSIFNKKMLDSTVGCYRLDWL